MNTVINFFIEQKKLSLLIFSLLSIWLLAFYPGLLSASHVWWTSEIYHHCFLVLPISLWLIFLKRNELIQAKKKINYVALPLIGFLIFVQVFGVAGDIKLFQYIATFAMIPCVCLFFMGLRACLIIFFPLFFLIFAIPVGDELIPTLQIITADLSVFFLNFTGVSIFREGLIIEIPNGRFLVAEACSGISFLIVSIVFGSLYAYLYLQSYQRKLLFVFLAFAVPIIANALRVMGIVIIGDVWGMEYASGTDHLIYGGVFYCVVLFLLIMIGEKIKDKELITTAQFSYPQLNFSKSTSIRSGLIILLLLGGGIWQNIILYPYIQQKKDTLPQNLVNKIAQKSISTNPSLQGYSRKIEGQLVENKNVEVFVAWFDFGSIGDAFSINQQFYDKTKWRILKNDQYRLEVEPFIGKYNKHIIIDQFGKSHYFLSLYRINNQVFANKRRANLYYAWLRFSQKTPSVSIITLLKTENKGSDGNWLKALLTSLD